MLTEAEKLDVALAMWRYLSVPLDVGDGEYSRIRMRHARCVRGLPGSMSVGMRLRRDYYRAVIRGEGFYGP